MSQPVPDVSANYHRTSLASWNWTEINILRFGDAVLIDRVACKNFSIGPFIALSFAKVETAREKRMYNRRACVCVGSMTADVGIFNVQFKVHV